MIVIDTIIACVSWWICSFIEASFSQCYSRKTECIASVLCVESSITHSLGKKSGWHCTCLEYVLSGSSRAFHVQQALEYPWRALKLDVNWTFNETFSILSKRTSHKFFPLEKQISIEKHSVLKIGIHSII